MFRTLTDKLYLYLRLKMATSNDSRKLTNKIYFISKWFSFKVLKVAN